MVGASKNLAQTEVPVVCVMQEWTGHGPAAVEALQAVAPPLQQPVLREGVPLQSKS